MQTCYDCGTKTFLNLHHRCESCARTHAIQIHMLKIHLAGDLDWFGALEETALDS